MKGMEMVRPSEVGSCYSADPRDWVEGAEYSYRTGEHQLSVFLHGPTAAETDDIARGQAEFAIRVYRHVIFLLFRFGRQPWNSAPYSWHLVPFRQRQLPPEHDNTPTTDPLQVELLRVLLVDTSTGKVLALRDLRLPTEFSDALHHAIRKQSTHRYPGNHDYDRSVKDIEDLCPGGEVLLAGVTAHCVAPGDEEMGKMPVS